MMKKKPNYIPTSFRFTPDDIRMMDRLSERTRITNRTDLIRYSLKKVQDWLDLIDKFDSGTGVPNQDEKGESF